MEAMKGKKSSPRRGARRRRARGDDEPIHDIVFACDAGMGSSAMGASVLRRKIQDAGYGDVTVVNKAISTLTDDYDLVVRTRTSPTGHAARRGSAIHVSVDNFMGSPRYDEIVELLHSTNGAGAGAAVVGGGRRRRRSTCSPRSRSCSSGLATTRDEAITEAGELLVAVGAVDAVVRRLHARARAVGVHRTWATASRSRTAPTRPSRRSGARRSRSCATPSGIDWNGKQVKFVVGIAGAGNDHLAAARQDRPGLRGQGPGRRARGGPDRRGRPAHPRRRSATPTPGPDRAVRGATGPAPPRRCGARRSSQSEQPQQRGHQRGAEHHDQERRAQQQEHHRHGEPGRAGVQDQPLSGANTCTATSAASRATGIRSATRSTTGSLEHPRRHREPGELQQVAAHAGAPGSPSTSSVGLRDSVGSGPRVSSPASSATPRRRQHRNAGGA